MNQPMARSMSLSIMATGTTHKDVLNGSLIGLDLNVTTRLDPANLGSRTKDG
jgi:hypothetical protein